MKNQLKIRISVLLIAALLLTTAAVGATLSVLTRESDLLVNTFNAIKYTIKYDDGVADGDPAPVTGMPETPQTIYGKASYTLASVPLRAGYTFVGWNDGTALYAAGSEYTLTPSKREITFTAKWSDISIDVTTVQDSDTIKKVDIKNTGDAAVYIRAAIVANWVDEDKKIVQAWTNDVETDTENWVQGADGYYYCRNMVAANESAPPLFGTYQATGGPEGAELEFKVMAQAVVQDDSKEYVTSAWGSTAAGYLN